MRTIIATLFLILLVDWPHGIYGCTCIREIENIIEYEYLLNSVGIFGADIHSEESVLSEDGKKMKSLEVEFSLKLILIEPELNVIEKTFEELKNEGKKNSSKTLLVKFIPQSTCSIACQDVALVRESWLVQNEKILKRETILKLNKKQEELQRHNHEYSETPLTLIRNEFGFGCQGRGNSSFKPLNFNSKIDILDFVDRGQCCHECCNLFVKSMRAKIALTKDFNKIIE